MAEYTNDMFGLQQLMRDEEAAKEQSYIDNAYKLGGGKRAGMMLYAMGDARRTGEAYESLGNMITGKGVPVDPRVERMNKITAIRDKIPEPETIEDFQNLANLFNQNELFGEAQKAIEMVNSIRSSMPKPSNDYKTYSEMTENPTAEGFKEWYKEFKVGNTTNKTTKQMALSNFIKSKPYIDGTKTIMDFEKDFEAAGRAPSSTSITDPTKIAQSNILNNSINDAYQVLLNDPANEGIPLEDLMEDAKVIGSNKFLEESETATKGDTSQNVDDFIYWKGVYPEKSDDDIRELVAAMKPTSPQNVLLNENRAFNREAIAIRQTEGRTDVREAKVNLLKTNAMLEAYKVGANSGWGEEWLNTGRKIGEDFFGLPQSEGTIATEVLESLFKDYTLDRMAKLKGTPSDKDLDLVELAGATMNRSRAANMIIIEFDAFQQQEKIDQQAHMTNWYLDFVDTNGEAPSGAKYDQYLNEFRNRGDASKWSGTEEDRLSLIDAYGNNEFNGFDKLANIDANKSEVQIKIEALVDEEAVEAAAAALFEFQQSR